MGVILDAWKAFWDPATNAWLFGEAKKKHTRYMDLRAKLKRQPLTNVERKVMESADRRAELYSMPWTLAAYVPANVWIKNRFGRREVQNRFLRVVARQPSPVIVVYSISALFVESYVRAEIADMFFTRDSGIVQLAQKYQWDDSSEGAKRGKAPDGFIYGIDRTREAVTSVRLTSGSPFGEGNKKFTRYTDLLAHLKRQPLTDAERKVVEAAHGRSALYVLPITIGTFGPPSLWAYNRFVRTVQNRFLRTVAKQPLRFHVVYAIAATVVWSYAMTEIIDKVFMRDSGIVQLARKYQRDGSSEGAKRDEAPVEFVYGMDHTSEGGTSGETDF